MTRLVKEDLFNTAQRLPAYDALFKKQTGKTLVQTAKKAAGIKNDIPLKSAAVIPVTAGLGIITDFAWTVAEILRYTGADVTLTQGCDVTGLKEAYDKGCEIAFLADDDTFLACAAGKRIYSDNGQATGYGYAQALIYAIENRGEKAEGKKVLVLGAGPVGRSAAFYLARSGLSVCVYDTDSTKYALLPETEKGIEAAAEKPSPKDFLYIVDATTQGGFIGEDQVSEDTIIAAPGMPWGPTAAAMKKAEVIYDPLELGTLTMYFQCLFRMEDQRP